MNDSEQSETTDQPNSPRQTPPQIAIQSPPYRSRRTRVIRSMLYWGKIVIQPIVAIAVIVLLVFGFSYAQKSGFFVSADAVNTDSADVDDATEYVCPMLCVPPSKEPGNCPICGMKLKPRKVSGDPKDVYGMTVDPVTRRISNIQTVTAVALPLTKSIKTFGRISLDETSQATVSAYVDGRIEKMFVDYTGAEVKKGDQLASLYSPDLYSTQIELLGAKQAMEDSTSTRQRIVDSNRRLYESARKRLLEFGLPEGQVAAIERDGKANSRINIFSPMAGTVTEKMAVEGDYVKTGSPILKVADLTRVWLMLELLPEDAGLIRLGQSVTVRLRSRPGREFEGRVAFVDPALNKATQTIPVRVVIPNEAGLIRIGDYADATIQLESSSQIDKGTAVVVPRQAVLISGDESVAYVETKPGRFEFRKVKVGQTTGEQVEILDGIKPGEQVVSSAAFMVDAAFNMSGKPSLIDPNRVILQDEREQEPEPEQKLSPAQLAEIDEALSKLSSEDRILVEKQVFCPITESRLGLMGTPIKFEVDGAIMFGCCEGCRKGVLKDPEGSLAKIKQLKESGGKSSPGGETAKLPHVHLPTAELPKTELPETEADN